MSRHPARRMLSSLVETPSTMVKSLISKALALALGGVLLASLPVDAVQSQTPTANTKKASKKEAA